MTPGVAATASKAAGSCQASRAAARGCRVSAAAVRAAAASDDSAAAAAYIYIYHVHKLPRAAATAIKERAMLLIAGMRGIVTERSMR